jgi:hypothetical protein
MATIVRGVAIRPVVSLNNRRYTPETLRKAHDRLAARLADPSANPVTMRLFHPKPNGQDASVEAIAGRLTKVSLTDEGGIAYEGQFNDTDAGRTAAALATPDADGRQHLANVSIRAYSYGTTPKDHNGIETPQDLEIVGLDLTDDPGVTGATVTASAESVAADETAGRVLLYESAEALTVVDSTESQVDEDAKALGTFQQFAATYPHVFAAFQRSITPTTEVDASADPKEPVMGEPTAEAAKAAEEARQAAATEQAAAITKAVTEGIAAGLAADRAARAEETVALEAKAAADKKAAEEAAAAAAVTEAATAELRASIRKELLAEQRNAGRPVRKGVVRVIDEAYDPSTLTRAERDEVLGDTLVHRLFPHLENSIA